MGFGEIGFGEIGFGEILIEYMRYGIILYFTKSANNWINNIGYYKINLADEFCTYTNGLLMIYL